MTAGKLPWEGLRFQVFAAGWVEYQKDAERELEMTRATPGWQVFMDKLDHAARQEFVGLCKPGISAEEVLERHRRFQAIRELVALCEGIASEAETREWMQAHAERQYENLAVDASRGRYEVETAWKLHQAVQAAEEAEADEGAAGALLSPLTPYADEVTHGP